LLLVVEQALDEIVLLAVAVAQEAYSQALG
jgi:hypothetical protein